jgi:NDP-sugar pyrophosphorylase family protein
LGSRYGGLKQLDELGPSGEIIMDFSLHDALDAGFTRVVFVVREHFLKEFQERMDARWGQDLDLHYVCQELSSLPEGIICPGDRIKPWGTAHALWLCREVIPGGFAIINADDFYGAAAYGQLHNWLHTASDTDARVCIVGYPLEATLSGHGAVSRGICDVTDKGQLATLTERKGVERKVSGEIICLDGQNEIALEPGALASMNLFGFTPAFFDFLDQDIRVFFAEHLNEAGAECFLPMVVNDRMKSGQLTVDIVKTQSAWLGITFPDDKPQVAEALRQLVDAGHYPRFSSLQG